MYINIETDRLIIRPINLKSAKEYGFLDRVMFGSDQMVCPDAIRNSIDFLNDLDFLTKEEKEMIFYKNAKKFLSIED